MKKKLEEQIIQKLPYRCPYCDHPIKYGQFNLKIGENEIQCPSCKKKYIKVVFDESPPPQSSPIKGEEKKGSPIKGEGIHGCPRVKGEEKKGFPIKEGEIVGSSIRGGEILGNFPAKGKRNKSR